MFVLRTARGFCRSLVFAPLRSALSERSPDVQCRCPSDIRMAVQASLPILAAARPLISRLLPLAVRCPSDIRMAVQASLPILAAARRAYRTKNREIQGKQNTCRYLSVLLPERFFLLGASASKGITSLVTKVLSRVSSKSGLFA